MNFKYLEKKIRKPLNVQNNPIRTSRTTTLQLNSTHKLKIVHGREEIPCFWLSVSVNVTFSLKTKDRTPERWSGVVDHERS